MVVLPVLTEINKLVVWNWKGYVWIMGEKNLGYYVPELFKTLLVSKSGIYLMNSIADEQRLKECFEIKKKQSLQE